MHLDSMTEFSADVMKGNNMRTSPQSFFFLRKKIQKKDQETNEQITGS